MATLTALAPMLEVTDLAETIAFYEGLGFACQNRLESDGKLVWAYLCRDAAQLMFTWTPPHDHAEGEDHDHGPALAGSLYFYPDDVEALWVELREKAPVVQEIGDRDYGMRDFSLRDPNGYLISFGAPVANDL